MSTTINKNSSKNSSKDIDRSIELSTTNARKVRDAAKKLKKSSSFIVNSLLDRVDLVSIPNANS